MLLFYVETYRGLMKRAKRKNKITVEDYFQVFSH